MRVTKVFHIYLGYDLTVKVSFQFSVEMDILVKRQNAICRAQLIHLAISHHWSY